MGIAEVSRGGAGERCDGETGEGARRGGPGTRGRGGVVIEF